MILRRLKRGESRLKNFCRVSKMDKIEKVLKRLSERERDVIKQVLTKLVTGDTKDLHIRKLKGREDIFRVRKGNIRIIYRVEKDSVFVLKIDRRREDTYKF